MGAKRILYRAGAERLKIGSTTPSSDDGFQPVSKGGCPLVEAGGGGDNQGGSLAKHDFEQLGGSRWGIQGIRSGLGMLWGGSCCRR
jgi:hypothetical protein